VVHEPRAQQGVHLDLCVGGGRKCGGAGLRCSVCGRARARVCLCVCVCVHAACRGIGWHVGHNIVVEETLDRWSCCRSCALLASLLSVVPAQFLNSTCKKDGGGVAAPLQAAGGATCAGAERATLDTHHYKSGACTVAAATGPHRFVLVKSTEVELVAPPLISVCA